MINKLFAELSAIEQVEAISLGGSRSGENYDEKSDYDVYLYITAPVAEEIRRAFWENTVSTWKSAIITGRLWG